MCAKGSQPYSYVNTFFRFRGFPGGRIVSNSALITHSTRDAASDEHRREAGDHVRMPPDTVDLTPFQRLLGRARIGLPKFRGGH
jgi:hypothetical protein